MSAERDELLRLVQDIPEDQVPMALADLRRHLRPASERPWPPAFFASAPGDGTRIADQADELLREGFGRQPRVIVCDTAPLVAAALYRDPDHRRCVDLFAGLRMANRPMLLPAPIVAEVGYLLAAKAGSQVEANFLRALAAGDFVPVDLSTADYERMAELVDQYADLPLGTSDASVIALAERLNIAEVATLDLRHFTVVRPRHVKALTLLPEH